MFSVVVVVVVVVVAEVVVTEVSEHQLQVVAHISLKPTSFLQVEHPSAPAST